MGVTAVTLHVSGGSAMLKAALAARPRPWVWGVTVLTSLGAEDLREVGVSVTPATQVLRLARLAQKVGLDGMVCSPREVHLLRTSGVRLTLVTPGIQFGNTGGKDQKRIATPSDAWAAGSNYLVVGRSVLAAKNPSAAVRTLLEWRDKQ
jgi:orotidine-5'-phosphate decarboxylase